MSYTVFTEQLEAGNVATVTATGDTIHEAADAGCGECRVPSAYPNVKA